MKKIKPFEKKKFVVAKITRLELDVFKAIELARSGLINSLVMVEEQNRKTWKILIKDYKISTDKILKLDEKTREIYYEDFPEEG